MTNRHPAGYPARRPVLFAAAMLAFTLACAPAPAPDAAGDSESTASSPARADVRLLGTCCGATDAEIQATMQRYEATPGPSRTPELAIFPYRHSGGIETRERLVVRDMPTWARLWTRMLGSHSPKPEPPEVDFGREMLVVVTMGQQSSGGYGISIDEVTGGPDSVRVTVTERSPGRTCGTTAALTQPMMLARITRTDLPIAFVERQQTTNC